MGDAAPQQTPNAPRHARNAPRTDKAHSGGKPAQPKRAVPEEVYDHIRQIVREELASHIHESAHDRAEDQARQPQGSGGTMTGSQLRREPFGDFISAYHDGQWHTVLAPAGTASANDNRKRKGERRSSSEHDSHGSDGEQGRPGEEDVESQAGDSRGSDSEQSTAVKEEDGNSSKPGQGSEPAGTAEGVPQRVGKDPAEKLPGHGRGLLPKEVLMRSADLLNKRKTMARPDGVLTAEPAILHDLERRIEKLHGIQRTFPNPVARFRYEFRESLAEFTGTFVLMVMGTASNCLITLSSLMGEAKGNLVSQSLAWGVATGCGIGASGGISGGHLNPAITLALCVYRGFPVRRIPSYIFSQVLGSYVASLCVYGVYRHLITLSDPDLSMKSAGGFIGMPISAVVQPATVAVRISAFWNEVLGTAILMITALAAGDAHNTPPPEGMGPQLLLWTIIGLLCSFSLLDGAVFNPARDLGPRLALYTVGYGRKELWTFDGLYWLWCATLGPITGAMLGATMYDAAVYQGSESLMNKPFRLPFISNTSDGHFTRALVKALCSMHLPARLILWMFDLDSAAVSQEPPPHRDHPDEKGSGYWDDESQLSHHQHRQGEPLHRSPSSTSDETLANAQH